MDIETASFRHGVELLRNLPELHELTSVISGITAADIVAQQQGPLQGRPVGAQKALNQLFRERLGLLLWAEEVPLFANPKLYPGRNIDFMKNHLGVEVAFNHESYAERILFRLNVASESDAIIPAHVVHGGVIVVASDAVKQWGSMDPSVGTFDGWRRSVELVKSSFSVPLVLLGLFPDPQDSGWSQPSTAFGRKPPTPPSSDPVDDD
jgi:hypothetical protein